MQPTGPALDGDGGGALQWVETVTPRQLPCHTIRGDAIIPSRYDSFMEKTIKRTTLKGSQSDREYWRSRSPQERLDAVEILRQQYFALRPNVEQRLQRVCRVTQLRAG